MGPAKHILITQQFLRKCPSERPDPTLFQWQQGMQGDDFSCDETIPVMAALYIPTIALGNGERKTGRPPVPKAYPHVSTTRYSIIHILFH